MCVHRDDETDKIVFRGWARMAVPIEDYTIIEVRKPNVGENKPADVTADIVIDTSRKHSCDLAAHPFFAAKDTSPALHILYATAALQGQLSLFEDIPSSRLSREDA